MKDFPGITNAVLNRSTINKLKNYFNNKISYLEGESIISVTPVGGIHYTGHRITTNSVAFEILRKNSKLIILLIQYPKGVLFHAYIYYPDVDKYSGSDWKYILDKIYTDISEILTNI